MVALRRNVSSLNLLATFEAAARLGSFTLASAELGVTQAAVSQQIKTLERELNTPLFTRAHRRVGLTPAGRALAGVVGTSFTAMSDVIDTIRRPELPDTVALGVTLAFNQFWLMPRLPDFRARHPNIRLRLVADDAAMDLRHARLDVAVRYGKPPFEDAVSHGARAEIAFPVASPTLFTRLGLAPETPLEDLPLIACDIVNPAWMPWRAWARARQLGPALERRADQSQLRFNHYSDTVQAALNGEGVTMGWDVLLSDHLREGRLVRIGGDTVVPEAQYHIATPLGQRASATCQALIDWLKAHLLPQA